MTRLNSVRKSTASAFGFGDSIGFGESIRSSLGFGAFLDVGSKLGLGVAVTLMTGSVLAEEVNNPNVVAVEQNMASLLTELVQSNELALSPFTTSSVAEVMISKKARVGISSKKWSDKQVARFEMRAGYRPTELMFTADVIAILANEENPVESITLTELKQVFGCSSSPENIRWQPISLPPISLQHSSLQSSSSLQATSSLGNESQPIQPYMLPFAIDGDFSMHSTFSNWVACLEGEYTNTQFLADTEDLTSKVDQEEASIGYAVYSDQISQSKWLSITDDLGVTYDLNKETILSGRYPLATVYYLYLDLPPHRDHFTEQEQFFIDLTLTDEYKPILNEYGFISLPPEAIHRNKVRLSLSQPVIEGGYK